MKISVNRKAYYEFSILESFDAGIVLQGSEVKSIRQHNVSIMDSFAYVSEGEVWLKNMKISKYKQAHPMEKIDENRDKKLLLNRREINKIEKLLQDTGTTIVPLEIFTTRNKIKIKIAVVKGKRQYDKRESIKKRETNRELKRSYGL